MKRRDILKSLGILPIGLFVPKLSKIETLKQEIRIGSTIHSYEVYKEFKYFWTDWKQSPDTPRIVGQWIASNSEDINIYSGSNGKSGQFYKGACFELTTVAPRKLLEVGTSEVIKEYHKSWALDDLFKEIDKYYEELKNPQKQPEYKFTFNGFKVPTDEYYPSKFIFDLKK